MERFRGGPLHLPVAVPDPIATFMPRLQKRHYALFWALLLGGIGGLIALTVAVVRTRSVVLEYAFVVGGSLLIPCLYVYYLDLRNEFVDPRWRVLVPTFILGAVLGGPIALLLETHLPAGTGKAWPAFVTGLCEEFAKLAGIFWLLRRRFRYLQFEMDGIIVGAAAGMGFAALEDMLYGAGAFSHSLGTVVVTVWSRQILAPFGHGTWTAIVGAAIWRAKGGGHPRVTPTVIVAYLFAAGLHGLWDWEPWSGWGTLLWFLFVGVLGLLVLRSLVQQALAQEGAYQARLTGQADPAP